MPRICRRNLSEETAGHLREGFRVGQWSGRLPGVCQLSRELGVSRDTVRTALRRLEEEGWVINCGAGKSRVVNQLSGTPGPRLLRVGILLASPLAIDNAHTHELIFSVRQAIEAAGHVCLIAPKSALQFSHRVERIERYLATWEVDAWMVYSSRREILEMMSKGPVPTFALGGQAMGLPIACSRADLRIPICACVDLLVGFGHQRITLIAPPKWRPATPNSSAQIFLDRLSDHGIRADASYYLPDWDPTPAGLNALLEALFFATPPSALLVVEPECIGPVLVFLAQRGLRVPEHVSVVNLLPDPVQGFYRPALAHFQWPIQPHVKRVIRWLNALARGEWTRSMQTTEPAFVPAESIGPKFRSP